jgi:hypothetical protein
MHARRCSTLLFSCALLAASGFAQSNEPNRPGPALETFKNHSGPTLTGAALRRCVALDSELRALAGQLKQETQNLEVAEHYFKRLGEDLDHDETTLDHTDGDAVDRYNDRVRQHERLVEDYNARLPANTALVMKHNELVDRFNGACTGRAYLVKEWIEADALLGVREVN